MIGLVYLMPTGSYAPFAGVLCLSGNASLFMSRHVQGLAHALQEPYALWNMDVLYTDCGCDVRARAAEVSMWLSALQLQWDPMGRL